MTGGCWQRKRNEGIASWQAARAWPERSGVAGREMKARKAGQWEWWTEGARPKAPEQGSG